MTPPASALSVSASWMPPMCNPNQTCHMTSMPRWGTQGSTCRWVTFLSFFVCFQWFIFFCRVLGTFHIVEAVVFCMVFAASPINIYVVCCVKTHMSRHSGEFVNTICTCHPSQVSHSCHQHVLEPCSALRTTGAVHMTLLSNCLQSTWQCFPP